MELVSKVTIWRNPIKIEIRMKTRYGFLWKRKTDSSRFYANIYVQPTLIPALKNGSFHIPSEENSTHFSRQTPDHVECLNQRVDLCRKGLSSYKTCKIKKSIGKPTNPNSFDLLHALQFSLTSRMSGGLEIWWMRLEG